MPHKRAKKAVRERTQRAQGTDNAPSDNALSIRNEPIPKSAHRILNAVAIRNEFHKRKLNDGEDGPASKKRKRSDPAAVSLQIQPGESMQHFIRRVEDDMRPLVRSAAQAGRALERNTAREETAAKKASQKAKSKKQSASSSRSPSPSPSKPPPAAAVPAAVSSSSSSSLKSKVPKKDADQTIRDFAKASTSAPKRLNDIAQAPPELKKLPRGVAKGSNSTTATTTKRTGILSMAQQAMMEAEREKAIARYRQLKADRRLAETGPEAKDG